MNIKIANKEYKLYFGLDFIEQLDDTYPVEKDGLSIGIGTGFIIGMLRGGNPKYLIPIIKAATCTIDSPPTEKEIKEYIESIEDVEKVINDFLEILENSPLLKMMLKREEAIQEKREQRAEIMKIVTKR